MRIYQPEPDDIIKVIIYKVGEGRQYLNLYDTTLEEVEAFIKKVIQDKNLSVFEGGKKTQIQIRPYKGGQYLIGAKSVSFRGMSALETYNAIVEAIQKK